MNTRHHYLSLLRTFALATLTAAAVTACTDDNGDPDGREPITPADGIPVTFTANINPGSDANPDTRTVLESDGNGGFTVEWKGTDNNPTRGYDLIRIWAAKDNTLTSESAKYYVPATSAASSTLEPEDNQNKLTLPSTGEWTFTAIYGNSGFLARRPYISVSSLRQSAPGKTEHIAGNDFSVATATKHVETGDMPDIDLRFHHLLSALQLRITNQTGEELTVKEIRLSAAGGQITMQKTYDVAQGKWKTDQVYKEAYLKLTAENFPALATGGASQDLHMLLFPEPDHGGTDMTITVITDRGEYTLTKPAPDGGFLAGKNYLTNIAITSTPGTNETWTETISTPEQLAAFREKVNGGDNYYGKTVRLADNIDLANASWTPIGSSSKNFRGTFDGRGYHISGLNVNNGNASYAGLFGYVVNGKVRNLRVSGNVTTTGDYAGGIAGQLQSSTVENCIFSGTVNGRNSVGGIAGFNNSSSRIAGCHTKGSVTATASYGGGIVGSNFSSSSIDGCYSEAEVKAPGQTGGIVGENQSSTVTHCYATGKVSGSTNVGGIAGYTNGGTFTGCIALNPGLTRTSGAAVTFGRIVGINYNAATLTSCAAFNDMTIKDASTTDFYADATGEHGTDLTADACLTEATYTDREFTTDNGWAFSYSSQWMILPWNPAFQSFSGITLYEYSIKPQHIIDALSN